MAWRLNAGGPISTSKIDRRIRIYAILMVQQTRDHTRVYKCFIDIMKFQRERVVWNCCGISITENLFRQAIVSSTSAILLALGLAIRGYMVQSGL